MKPHQLRRGQLMAALDETFDNMAAEMGRTPQEAAAIMASGARRGGTHAITYERWLKRISDVSGLSRDELLLYLELRADPDITHKREAAVSRALQLAREWTCPSGVPVTAGNLELLAMNAARFLGGLEAIVVEHGFDCEPHELGSAIAEGHPTVARCVQATAELVETLRIEDDDDATTKRVSDFLESWFHSAFARLEVGHKYAAALCCTDVPAGVEVLPPWDAWSLVLPPDLLGENTPARIWVHGLDWVASLWPNGVIDLVQPLPAGAKMATSAQMIENLIRGCCLSITDAEQHRRGGSSSRAVGNKRKGAPDLVQSRFLLAPPVSVDLRAHVLEALRGGTGGSAPRVQFLVRGHWRSQVHGPRRGLRKTIWVEPFWKGPESARVLLRTHKVVTNDEKKGDPQ